tara:strand:+ start:174 stop:353 length:180 start_codon:yes stop_codon:yes gene_type:complete
MNINLETEEVQIILNVLGELPSKSGAWPLMMKIQAQAQEQMPEPEEGEESDEPEEATIQ